MGEPVGQDGVEGRFREAMAGLLKRLQAYESDPTLEELYQKYGTAPNGTVPRPIDLRQAPPTRADSSGETRRPVPGERRPGGSGETRRPTPSGSGETAVRPTPSGAQPTRSGSGETAVRPTPSGAQPTRSGSGETAVRPTPSGAQPTRSGSGETAVRPTPSGAQPTRSGSGETAAAQAQPATGSLPDLDTAVLPVIPESPTPELVEPDGEEILEEEVLEEEIVEEVIFEEEVLEGEEILEEIVLEEGEEILAEEVFEPSYESEEPVPSEEGPKLPDLSSLPPLPPLGESGEFERVPSRNESMELPGGYTGQGTVFSTTPAMSPAQPAGEKFAPPVGKVTTKIPIAGLMTPAPPAAERQLTKEDEDGIAKRRVARIKCDYVAPARSDKGDSFEVRITDLAIEGAGVSAAVPLERGQVLTLSQPPSVAGDLGQPVQGRLMWVQSAGGRSEAGVMFIESHEAMSTSWVVQLLDQLTGDENQSLMEDKHLAEKKETLTVRAESPDGVKAVGRLLNLGLGSAKVSLNGEYKKNSKVDIILGPYQELEALLLPGLVLSVRDDDEDDRWVHDVRFLEKSSHQTGVLGRYVLALLQESDM